MREAIKGVIRGHDDVPKHPARSELARARGAHRRAQVCPGSKGHQRSSKVVKGHQGSSRVIKGHQGSSRVINGYQGSSPPLGTGEPAAPLTPPRSPRSSDGAAAACVPPRRPAQAPSSQRPRGAQHGAGSLGARTRTAASHGQWARAAGRAAAHSRRARAARDPR